MKKLFLFAAVALAVSVRAADNGQYKQASLALIQRIIPQQAHQFSVELIAADNGLDVFEIEASGGKVTLRGNNPVSVASALNWYLKYYCHCQVSWNGDNLRLPSPLPPTEGKVRKTSPYKYRVYFNYCTFSYTMPWWDWQRWQREIDWMAMHGVNTPLAITGQEAVWQNTLRQFRMSDEEIRRFLVGPAYFAWQFMTNIEGWRGPLPQSWIDSHVTLGQQILERERSLGMSAILQGFTGYVPRLLSEKYPDARIACQGDWFGVPPGPAQLDPMDPLFPQIGATFMREQEKLFGTDHMYAADPFHEGKPPVKGDQYLQDVGRVVYETMREADPASVVMMQTWSLRKPIVQAIPADKIVLLDLAGAKWEKNEGFWGRPWVAGVLHNFGGRVFLGGNLPSYLLNAPSLLKNPEAGNLRGIGIFAEAIEQNPIVYEAASEIAWMDEAPDPARWVDGYRTARYGASDPATEKAWDVLRRTVYAQRRMSVSMESVICARPVLKFQKVAPNGNIVRDYDQRELWRAWEYMLDAGKGIKATQTYQYDLVDVARQCLADLSLPMQKRLAEAYERHDAAGFERYAAQFLSLMDDMDALLGTREEFLLGKWLGSAKAWGATPQEKQYYEANARNLVTAWGPITPKAVQYDYSNRQWSGLIKGYYKPRWEMFFEFLRSQKNDDTRYSEQSVRFDHGRPAHYANEFYSRLSEWEKEWIERTDSYPDKPQGDPAGTAARLYGKYKGLATELIPVPENKDRPEK